MDKLTFRFAEEEEVILPASLLDTELSLAEIGCLFLFYALDSNSKVPHARLASPEVSSASKSLRAKGVLKVQVEGTTVKIDIDLSKAPLAPSMRFEEGDKV